MNAPLWCLVLFFAVSAACAGASEVEWSVRFPSSGESSIWDVAADSSSGYFVVGETGSSTTERKILTTGFVNAGGLVLTDNSLLSFGNASAHAVERLPEGFAVCATVSDSYGEHAVVFMSKPNGDVSWRVDLGGGKSCGLHDLCITPSGDILSVGYSHNAETSEDDVYAVCISDTGTVLWERSYISPGYQTAYSVVTDSASGFTVTGSDNGDIFLMKIDSSGNWLWKTNHHSEGSETGRALIQTSDGGYVVAGSTRSEGVFSDALLVFFDDEGKVVREFVWGADGPDSAVSILEVPPAGFVVLVNTNPGTGEGYRPVLFRFDPWLSVIWSTEIMDGDAIFSRVRRTPDGGFVAAGRASHPESGPGYSSALVKLLPEDLFNWN